MRWLRATAIALGALVILASAGVAWIDVERTRIRQACDALLTRGIDATFYPHTCFLKGARQPMCWRATCIRDRTHGPSLERT